MPDYQAEADALVRRHMERMKTLSRVDTATCAGLANMNVMLIAYNAAVSMPKDVRIPSEALKELNDLLNKPIAEAGNGS